MTMTTNSPASPVPRKSILSRITGRWWRIGLLWMVVTVPLLSVISLSIEPRFEAFSMLRVEPAAQKLYEAEQAEQVDPKFIEPYLQTQVALLTSDRVFSMAIAAPSILKLSTINKSDDPKAGLRKDMVVETVPDAYLIRVALKLANGNEAAAIVNAVVNSYLAYNAEYNRSKNSNLRASLLAQQVKIQNEIKEKRVELRTLCQKGTLDVPGSAISLNESVKESDPTQPAFSSVTEELSQLVASEMVNTDLDLIKAQAILEANQAGSQGENDLQARQTLGELRLNVAVILKQKESLAKYFARVKVAKTVLNNDTFEATFMNRQLEILLKSSDQLNTNIEELEHKNAQEGFRVTQLDPATAPKVPTNNNRVKYMAAAPIVVFSMLIGLFLLLPIRDEPLSQSSAKLPPQDELGR